MLTESTEQRLVEFLEENGGTRTTKQIFDSDLGVSAGDLHKLVSALESKGKAKYGNNKLSLISETHSAQKKKVKPIEDENWVKDHQIDLGFDEYTLQPDERTKEQVAEMLQCSLRNIEILKKAGKLPAQKLRRRVDGIVRSQLIFKVEDIEDYKSKIDAPVNLPQVAEMIRLETDLQKTNNYEMDNSQKFAFGNFMQGLLQNAQLKRDEPPFMTVKEAAEFSHLSESCLRQLVAEEVLKKFTGKHGETMISRKQLLEL